MESLERIVDSTESLMKNQNEAQQTTASFSAVSNSAVMQSNITAMNTNTVIMNSKGGLMNTNISVMNTNTDAMQKSITPTNSKPSAAPLIKVNANAMQTNTYTTHSNPTAAPLMKVNVEEVGLDESTSGRDSVVDCITESNHVQRVRMVGAPVSLSAIDMKDVLGVRGGASMSTGNTNGNGKFLCFALVCILYCVGYCDSKSKDIEIKRFILMKSDTAHRSIIYF